MIITDHSNHSCEWKRVKNRDIEICQLNNLKCLLLPNTCRIWRKDTQKSKLKNGKYQNCNYIKKFTIIIQQKTLTLIRNWKHWKRWCHLYVRPTQIPFFISITQSKKRLLNAEMFDYYENNINQKIRGCYA